MSKINLPELPALSSNEINEACWKFIDAMPHELSGPVFNELKPALYAAICPALQAYAEQAVREALAAQEPVAWIAMVNGIPVDRPSRDRWLIERSAGSWTGGHVSALAIIPETSDG